MKDQCESLQALGIAAVQLNSALGSAEQHDAEAAIADGTAKIAMTTPERLQDPAFLELLDGRTVSLRFAVGARLPAGVPRNRTSARAARQADGAGAHRHGA
jgi:hypothetical protein